MTPRKICRFFFFRKNDNLTVTMKFNFVLYRLLYFIDYAIKHKFNHYETSLAVGRNLEKFQVKNPTLDRQYVTV